jgi:hypothetical protein
MSDMKDEREAILNESLANQSPRQLYERAVRAERRVEVMERALRSYRTAALGFAEAVREDTQTAYPWHPLDEAEKEAHAVLAQQEPDQPADAGEPSCCARTREEALQDAAKRCQDHGIEVAKEMMGHPAGSDKRERLQAKLGAHGLDVNSILNLCGKVALDVSSHDQ